jgi:hypothetical protein
MAYVTRGCKELKTDYKADTAEVGKEMGLIPVNGSNVPKSKKKGIA